MKNYIVYKHTNIINGKKYIGITSSSAKNRWGKNGKGYSNNKHFYNAICSYGWGAFIHEILAENLSKEEACEIERELIKKHKTQDGRYGYNHAAGGDTNQGWIMSDEDRIAKSKPVVQYTKEGIVLRKWNSALEACIELEYINTSRLLSVCRGERKTYKNYVWRFPEDNFDKYDFHNNRLETISKKVDQYSIEGKLLNTFDSVSDAARSIGSKSGSQISSACNGNLQKIKGYVWRWHKEPFEKYYTGRLSNDKKAVNQYNLNGKLIKKYNSCLEASKETGIPDSNIIKVCKGTNRRQAGGYIWRYDDGSYINIQLETSKNDILWEESYVEANKYFQLNGNLCIPRSYCSNGKKIGNWLHNQKVQYKAGKLKKYRVKKLEKIGVEW